MKKTKMNLVDYYNEKNKDEALRLLMSTNKIYFEAEGYIFEDLGKLREKLKIFKINKIGIKVLEDNISNFEVGSILSWFDLYCEFKHKGIFNKAYSELMKEINNEFEYIRVGVDYFKKSTMVDIYGVKRSVLLKWNKNEIKQDCYSGILSDLPKYDGFIMRPSNLNFQQSIGNYYNIYQKFPHIPKKCVSLDDIPWTVKMIKHVWGKQWELGLLYFQVKLLYPMQILPILTLVSKLNGTGKTTFANWVCDIIAGNSTIIDSNVIDSGFTEGYSEMNMVILEEVYSEKSSFINKLKALSTQKQITINKKNISMYKSDFFCSFIINSNHEENFIKIDKEDIRYWVLKLPQINNRMSNHNIEKDLRKEIPKFLGYLTQMPDVDFSKSRMVFTPEQIRTTQLDSVIESTRDWLYQDIKARSYGYFLDNPHIEHMEFRPVEMYDYWYNKMNGVTVKFLTKVINEEIKAKQSWVKARYRKMNEIESPTMTGNARYHTIRRDQFDDWNNDLEFKIVNDKAPF